MRRAAAGRSPSGYANLAGDRDARAAGRRRRRRPARSRADRSPSRPTPRAPRATCSASAMLDDAERGLDRRRGRAARATLLCDAAPRRLPRRAASRRRGSASALMRPSTRLASVTVGSVAAPAVADRAGIGAGAARPDLQRADFVEPGDAAAAGADLDDVDHRQHASAGRWRRRRCSSRPRSPGSPSLTRLAFAVVPPMSKRDDVAGCPARRRRRPAAMMPPTGPDSIIATGCCLRRRGRHHAAVGLHDAAAGRRSPRAQQALSSRPR